MKKVLTLALVFWLSPFAKASDIIPIDKALQPCAVCHGAQLMGNKSTGAPRLSNLPDWYIYKQIDAFKKGWRGMHEDDHNGAEMYAIAQTLEPETLKLAVDFINHVPKSMPSSSVDGDLTKGKQLYAQCASCHGLNGEGNQSTSAPPLLGLNDWYIVAQLKQFKQGIRGLEPEDTTGQMMRASAQLLKDETAMIDVATYISNLTSVKEKK